MNPERHTPRYDSWLSKPGKFLKPKLQAMWPE